MWGDVIGEEMVRVELIACRNFGDERILLARAKTPGSWRVDIKIHLYDKVFEEYGVAVLSPDSIIG